MPNVKRYTPDEAKSDWERHQMTAANLVNDMCFGHLNFDSVWGPYGSRRRTLRLSEMAHARIGQVFGYINGLFMCGNEPTGLAMAGWFVAVLDRLGEVGKLIEVGSEVFRETIPSAIVRVQDDGFWGSFSWMQFHYVPECEVTERHKETTSHTEKYFYNSRSYYRGMNGGLIFHCLREDGIRVDAKLRRDHNPWSLHS